LRAAGCKIETAFFSCTCKIIIAYFVWHGGGPFTGSPALCARLTRGLASAALLAGRTVRLEKIIFIFTPFTAIKFWMTMPRAWGKTKKPNNRLAFNYTRTRMFGRLAAFRHTTNHRAQKWYGFFQLYLQINYSIFCLAWWWPLYWLTGTVRPAGTRFSQRGFACREDCAKGDRGAAGFQPAAPLCPGANNIDAAKRAMFVVCLEQQPVEVVQKIET